MDIPGRWQPPSLDGMMMTWTDMHTKPICSGVMRKAFDLLKTLLGELFRIRIMSTFGEDAVWKANKEYKVLVLYVICIGVGSVMSY